MRRLKIIGPRGGRWQVDVPTTFRERMRGLRGRALGAHQAMLLERCRSVHTMGMTFSITVAFLDASSSVIRVMRTPAGRIVFCRRARHVLECHIGADVRVGDLLSPQAAPGGPTIRDGPGSVRPART
ncbi:MAG: DUF192 domain-containing protein [Actinomycetota bacterium]